MKAEQARKIADQALAHLTDALKKGKSEALTRYLAMLAHFHRYSAGNVMLIFWQRPDATHVAGFNTWKRLGRHVKLGEKGIVILAPMVLRPKTDDQSAEGEPKPQPVVRFQGVHVFDVSQTEGNPLPEPATVCGDPGEHTARLKALVAERGITLDHAGIPAGADGCSSGGRISIRKGLSPAQEFAVLAHELAHELLHHGKDRPQTAKVRETEAEAVASSSARPSGWRRAPPRATTSSSTTGRPRPSPRPWTASSTSPPRSSRRSTPPTSRPTRPESESPRRGTAGAAFVRAKREVPTRIDAAGVGQFGRVPVREGATSGLVESCPEGDSDTGDHQLPLRECAR
jgi:hypothetical protein